MTLLCLRMSRPLTGFKSALWGLRAVVCALLPGLGWAGWGWGVGGAGRARSTSGLGLFAVRVLRDNYHNYSTFRPLSDGQLFSGWQDETGQGRQGRAGRH